MRRFLASLFLTGVLLLGCLPIQASNPFLIPIYVHDPKDLASHTEVVKQVDQLNSTYRELGTPFSFRLAGDDTRTERVGGKRDLNVFITDEMDWNILGQASFPDFELWEDTIELSPDTLPGHDTGYAEAPPGTVLVHEVGHWLGLVHARRQCVGQRCNCMTNSGSLGGCYFSKEQINIMILAYGKYRV